LPRRHEGETSGRPLKNSTCRDFGPLDPTVVQRVYDISMTATNRDQRVRELSDRVVIITASGEAKDRRISSLTAQVEELEQKLKDGLREKKNKLTRTDLIMQFGSFLLQCYSQLFLPL
jgi:hypothetical protein